ncbi:MAG: TldD/PmbA family protein [Candidatus Zixiibacteriota bacterium]
MALDRKHAEDIVARSLEVSEADETLVFLNTYERGLTRFSENEIHQNVTERQVLLTVQAALGKKLGIARGIVNEDGDIKNVADTALSIARIQGEQEEYAGLADPADIPAVKSYSDATAAYGPDQRADAVGTVIGASSGAKMKAAGSFRTETGDLTVGNSKGVLVYHPYTEAELIAVAMGGDGSGYCEGGAWDVADIDIGALAEDAVRRAELSKNPGAVEPGEYDLIVEPYALGELFSWMSFVVFDTRAYQEGRTLLSKRMGDKIMGDNITIVDDGLSPETIPFPFDFEGVPRQRVTLVDRGKAVGVCYDLATAAHDGKKSTGHALPPGASYGPFPLNIDLAPGDSSVDEMIASMERGLYVTRFHYVNGFVEPMQAVFTGMTRDGTFLVEDGKIKRGLKNLRWTESMLRAFSNVKMMARERRLVNVGDGIRVVAPAVYFKDFTFTGTTEH